MGNLRKTWNLLKTIISGSQNNKPIIQELSSSNGIVINPMNIANAFNDYFINIGPTLANNIPKTTKSPVHYLNATNNNSMFITPTDTEEILSIVALLKPNASPGCDSISPKVVRKCISYIGNSLCDIFNKSLLSGVFPDGLNTAKVLPINKADDRLSVSNYRSISVLPFFLKFWKK